MTQKSKRNCPKCGRELLYTRRLSCLYAEQLGSVCRDCSNKRTGITITGRPRDVETRMKIKSSLKGVLLSAERKLNVSVGLKEAWKTPDKRKSMLSRCKWNNISADKGQLELIGKWNGLGFAFIPNYQVHTDDFLAYVDGYDPKHNVVMEYDSKYHSSPSRKEKDLVRQQRIVSILNPKKFWRYDAVNKTFRDVAERNGY